MSYFTDKNGSLASFINVGYNDPEGTPVVIYLLDRTIRVCEAGMFLLKFYPTDSTTRENAKEIEETIKLSNSSRTLFKHVKTGGTYLLEQDDLIIEETLINAVSYISTEDSGEFPAGTTWVRPVDQFIEKFTPLTDASKKLMSKLKKGK